MNLLMRIVLAVIAGVVVTAILNYIPVLNAQINALLGVIAAIIVFLNYDGRLPGKGV